MAATTRGSSSGKSTISSLLPSQSVRGFIKDFGTTEGRILWKVSFLHAFLKNRDYGQTIASWTSYRVPDGKIGVVVTIQQTSKWVWSAHCCGKNGRIRQSLPWEDVLLSIDFCFILHLMLHLGRRIVRRLRCARSCWWINAWEVVRGSIRVSCWWMKESHWLIEIWPL